MAHFVNCSALVELSLQQPKPSNVVVHFELSFWRTFLQTITVWYKTRRQVSRFFAELGFVSQGRLVIAWAEGLLADADGIEIFDFVNVIVVHTRGSPFFDSAEQDCA